MQEILVDDINHRKRAEEDLRRSETYLTEGHRLSHPGSWARNVSTGGLFSSQETFRIFGYDPNDTRPSYGKAFRQRIHPADKPSVDQALDGEIRERTDWEQDCRIVLPDGSTRRVHAPGNPVVDEDGDLVEYIGTVMDVTSPHQGKAALEKAFEIKILKDQRYRENLALREEIDQL